MKRVVLFCCLRRWKDRLIVALSLWPLSGAWAAGEDPLADLRGMITGVFGHHSTVMYGVYTAEVLVSGLIYLQTRNLQKFMFGTPILVVFTAAMYKLIGT